MVRDWLLHVHSGLRCRRRRREQNAESLLDGLLELMVVHKVSLDLIDLQVNQHTRDLWCQILTLKRGYEFKNRVAEHVLQVWVFFLHRGHDLLRGHHILTSIVVWHLICLLVLRLLLLLVGGGHHLGLGLGLLLLLRLLILVVLLVVVVRLTLLVLLLLAVVVVVVRFPLLIVSLLVISLLVMVLVLLLVLILLLLHSVLHR